MTDQARAEVNRYAQLDPIAQALVDDYDAIDLAAMFVKAQDDLALARAALIHNDRPIGARWLHVQFTSPHDTTANTSALNLADHLQAEFPGVGMRVTTNAVEPTPDCSANNPETEPNNPAAPTPPSLRTRIARAIHRYDHHGLSGKNHRGESDAILTELGHELAALAELQAQQEAPNRPQAHLIDPPDGSTVLAARHLDATEGPVQIGSTVDTSTRAAIDRVLDYVAKAHNSQTISAPGSKEQP